MIACPNCGGNTKFDIASQQILCEFCDTKYDPYMFDNKSSDAIEAQDFEVTVFTCPQCGGEILSTDDAAAGFCSFCGASTILYSRISHEKRPGYIIPFQKTKDDCKQSYAARYCQRLFQCLSIPVIYGVELSAIHKKENYEDDKGMQYKNASLKSDALNNVSPAKSGKKKGLIALGIAIIVSLAILFLHPIHDYLYYVGAILCLIAEFVTLVDLMGAYNLLATRRLPQFDKKGGDDRA